MNHIFDDTDGIIQTFYFTKVSQVKIHKRDLT